MSNGELQKGDDVEKQVGKKEGISLFGFLGDDDIMIILEYCDIQTIG